MCSPVVVGEQLRASANQHAARGLQIRPNTPPDQPLAIGDSPLELPPNLDYPDGPMISQLSSGLKLSMKGTMSSVASPRSRS